MGKKSYQAEARYAKKGTQPRKKRSYKPKTRPTPKPGAETSSVSEGEATHPARAVPPTRPKQPETSMVSATYAHVISDLKRTGVFAACAFIILIILAVVL